jgi:hypothetical protein
MFLALRSFMTASEHRPRNRAGRRPWAVRSLFFAMVAASQAELHVKTVSDIVGELLKAHNDGKSVDLSKLKQKCGKRNGLAAIPQTRDIIAAIPENHKAALLPQIKTKPVRTASGIAVVAVMSKPHRCPHIATTGNVCVYCPGRIAQPPLRKWTTGS